MAHNRKNENSFIANLILQEDNIVFQEIMPFFIPYLLNDKLVVRSHIHAEQLIYRLSPLCDDFRNTERPFQALRH